ncbi:MAG: gamma-glutamyl-phosphate reductase, partial [Erysipelotrichaceae bacterium]|nr:gamma-glutamyl-phosphate reductase [Erysipelotrichaceae bacterium]
MNITEEARKAKEAFKDIRNSSTKTRNAVLSVFCDLLMERTSHILKENEKDIRLAKESSLSNAFIDRLTLNEERIKGMVQSVRKVIALPDPTGKILE